MRFSLRFIRTQNQSSKHRLTSFHRLKTTLLRKSRASVKVSIERKSSNPAALKQLNHPSIKTSKQGLLHNKLTAAQSFQTSQTKTSLSFLPLVVDQHQGFFIREEIRRHCYLQRLSEIPFLGTFLLACWAKTSFSGAIASTIGNSSAIERERGLRI